MELSIAAADSRPVTKFEEKLGVVRSPKAGYWYRTLRFDGETSPNPERFALCAYPDIPMAGKWMYIVSEKNVRYRKDFRGAPPPEVYPEDPEKEGWEKRDVPAEY
jgi:hypothetical protein